MTLPLPLTLVRDESVRTEYGFLRSLPLLMSRWQTTDFTYHWKTWYKPFMIPWESEGCLVPHRFVHSNDFGRAQCETIGLIWRRTSLDRYWRDDALALVLLLGALKDAGYEEAIIVTDYLDGLKLSQLDIRPLTEYAVSLDYVALYNWFQDQSIAREMRVLRMESQSPFLATLVAWDKARGHRVQQLSDLAQEEGILPRLVLRGLVKYHEPAALIDVDSQDIVRRLTPWVDSKQDLSVLANACWRLVSTWLREHRIGAHAPDDEDIAAIERIESPTLRRLVTQIAI